MIAKPFVAAAVAAMALGATPALADDWRKDRRDWREDRRHDARDRRDAYRAGYRAGLRADDRREYNRGRVVNGRWISNDGRYGNGWSNGRPYNGGYYNNVARYPVSSRNWVQGRDYWYGRDGRAYCRRSDGTTGTIVGAVAGGTLGNVIAGEGDKRLGSVIGGTLGAILGREIARGNVTCR
jgi:hypothetical protein